MDDGRPHFANITVSIKYLKDLPKLVQQYNVQLTLPIVVSPDVTETNFTVVGEHNDILRFVQKFANDRLSEQRAHIKAQQEEAKHIGEITKGDVTDVKILVNVCKDVNDFIKEMK